MKINKEFIRRSIELARRSREAGNHPFGALLAIDDEVVLTALNSVNTERDPLGHAETNLVQRANRELSTADMSGAVLYSSCEPCAMCTGAIYWSGIRKVVFALSAGELAGLTGGDFLVPCRDLFGHSKEKVEVSGPFLFEEAVSVHKDFWG